MRTIIDLPVEQVEALAKLCRQEKVPRTVIIRRAVARYLEQAGGGRPDEAFGLWKNKRINALRYEDQLRKEWSGA